MQSARLKRGVGIACSWYGMGNTALSNPSEMKVGIDAGGRITLYCGAVDIGQGSNTILTQIAADALGISASDVRLVMGDTARTLDAGKTSASRQTLVSGKACELAALDLKAKLAQVTDRALLRSLPADNHGDVLTGYGKFDPPTTPLDANGQGVPYSCYGFATQVALVEVDLDLGTVKVLKIAAAHDVGKAVNPQQVEGQIHGGTAQGIGLALMEEYIPGRTENLHDYLIPTFGDMPEMICEIVEAPTQHGPHGAKGVGEPALISTAPAIFGGIYRAAGVRVTKVPVLPHRLRAAIRAKEAKR
jgi:CO/xanthine dehydrogenase Mo-binding subunit